MPGCWWGCSGHLGWEISPIHCQFFSIKKKKKKIVRNSCQDFTLGGKKKRNHTPHTHTPTRTAFKLQPVMCWRPPGLSKRCLLRLNHFRDNLKLIIVQFNNCSIFPSGCRRLTHKKSFIANHNHFEKVKRRTLYLPVGLGLHFVLYCTYFNVSPLKLLLIIFTQLSKSVTTKYNPEDALTGIACEWCTLFPCRVCNLYFCMRLRHCGVDGVGKGRGKGAGAGTEGQGQRSRGRGAGAGTEALCSSRGCAWLGGGKKSAGAGSWLALCFGAMETDCNFKTL